MRNRCCAPHRVVRRVGDNDRPPRRASASAAPVATATALCVMLPFAAAVQPGPRASSAETDASFHVATVPAVVITLYGMRCRRRTRPPRPSVLTCMYILSWTPTPPQPPSSSSSPPPHHIARDSLCLPCLPARLKCTFPEKRTTSPR